MSTALEKVEGILSGLKQKTADKRSAKKKKNTLTAYRKIWEDALRQFFPGAAVLWTPKEARQLRWATDSLSMFDIPAADAGAFVEWCVENWTHVVTRCIPIRKKDRVVPKEPSVGYLLAYRADFVRAYRDSLTPSVAPKMQTADQSELNMLRKTVEAYRKEAEHYRHKYLDLLGTMRGKQ